MNVLFLILILLVAGILLLQLLHLIHLYGFFSRDAKNPREAFMRLDVPNHSKNQNFQVLSHWNDKPDDFWFKALADQDDPSGILHKAIDDFQQDPSVKKANLLIRLSNHISNRIRYDEKIDQLIEKVSELLKTTFMANVRLFEHTSIAGRQLFITHTKRSRYLLAGGDFLNRYEFNKITSSVRLCAGAEKRPQMCLLFEDERFGGKFKVLAFHEDRNLISLPYYNDLTSSAILVSHDPGEKEIVINFRNSAGKEIDEMADSLIRDMPGFRRNGDVALIFAIDAFEIGQFGNDLVKAVIPIEYHPPFLLKKTNITISFYIDLFIAEDNILKSAVSGWHYRVEPGILANDLENKLKRNVPRMTQVVESSLGNMLHEMNWRRWKDVYLLPGRMNKIDEDYEGDTSDDCSVVLIPAV